MKKIFRISLLVGAIGLLSFSHPQRTALLGLFENVGEINLNKLEFVDADHIITPVGYMAYYKDHLIIPDYSRSNKFLVVVDLKDKTVDHQTSRGVWSRNLLSPRPLKENYTEDCLTVYDDKLHKIIYYDLIDSKLIVRKIEKHLYKKRENLIGRIVCVDSTKILFDGIFQGRKEKYQIRDLETGVSSYFGKHPDFKRVDTLSSGECFLAMQGLFALRPDSQMAVYATMDGGLVDFINLNEKAGTINRKKFYIPEIQIFSSKLTRFSTRPFQLVKGSLEGFSDVKVTQDHVYLLFSGNERIRCGDKPDETCRMQRHKPILLQFDWQGNALKKWSFDRHIRSFAINHELNQIYVMEKSSTNTLLVGDM